MQGLRFGDRVPYRGRNWKVIIEIPPRSESFLADNQKAEKKNKHIFILYFFKKRIQPGSVALVFNGTLKESSPLFSIPPKDCIDLVDSQ